MRKQRKETKTIAPVLYCGLDLSLTGTGVCVIDSQGTICFVTKLKSKTRGMERLQGIRDRVSEILEKYEPSFICVEGYSMGSRAGQAFSIGELGGVIKLMLYEQKREYRDVAPTQVKKFGAKKGNASKDQVMMNVYKEWGFEARSNDEADAFVLAQIARAFKKTVALRSYQTDVIIQLRKKDSEEEV